MHISDEERQWGSCLLTIISPPSQRASPSTCTRCRSTWWRRGARGSWDGGVSSPPLKTEVAGFLPLLRGVLDLVLRVLPLDISKKGLVYRQNPGPKVAWIGYRSSALWISELRSQLLGRQAPSQNPRGLRVLKDPGPKQSRKVRPSQDQQDNNPIQYSKRCNPRLSIRIVSPSIPSSALRSIRSYPRPGVDGKTQNLENLHRRFQEHQPEVGVRFQRNQRGYGWSISLDVH